MVGRWSPLLEDRGSVYTPQESIFSSILYFDEKDAFLSFVKCELEREKEEELVKCELEREKEDLNKKIFECESKSFVKCELEREKEDLNKRIFECESKSLVAADEILHRVSYYGAVDCATALINGETGQTVYLNVPCGNGVYPLHYAVRSDNPKLVELYLLLEARTDLRGICPISDRTNQLPLNTALSSLRKTWAYYRFGKESIFKLINLLCLPEAYSTMQIINLLASNTNETETVILQYAREGKLVELAALLIVAWRKLTYPVRKCIITMADEKALLLLQVVESAGDAIETYVKQDKAKTKADDDDDDYDDDYDEKEVRKEQIKAELQILLQQRGFVLTHRDIDFSEIER